MYIPHSINNYRIVTYLPDYSIHSENNGSGWVQSSMESHVLPVSAFQVPSPTCWLATTKALPADTLPAKSHTLVSRVRSRVLGTQRNPALDAGGSQKKVHVSSFSGRRTQHLMSSEHAFACILDDNTSGVINSKH